MIDENFLHTTLCSSIQITEVSRLLLYMSMNHSSNEHVFYLSCYSGRSETTQYLYYTRK
jgi:hypothetical protein